MLQAHNAACPGQENRTPISSTRTHVRVAARAKREVCSATQQLPGAQTGFLCAPLGIPASQ